MDEKKKKFFDKKTMISGATQMGEAVLGAGATTYAINKIPAGKIKKFVPGTALAGSLAVCLLIDNAHARSIALGSGIASSIALVKQFTEDKPVSPATVTTPAGEEKTDGLAGIKDVLKSAFIVEGGFSELGNVDDMNDDYMVDNFIDAYRSSPATEASTLLGLGNISNLI
jgi:hypothetical protein